MSKMNMSARPANLEPESFRNVTYQITVRPEVELGHVLDPKFWAIVARKMRPLNQVRVIWEDMTRQVDLIVLEASNVSARVGVLRDYDLQALDQSPTTEGEPGDYEMKWLSPTARYQVFRKKDGAEIARNLSKIEALKLIEERKIVDAH